jgi:hypothetical protein
VWLDSLLAVPLVGVKFESNMQAFLSYVNAIAAIQEQQRREGIVSRTELTLPFAQLGGSDGLHYVFDHNGVIVRYTYDLKVKAGAGQLPAIEVPPVKVYTELLALVERALIEAMGALETNTLRIHHVGVVASVKMASTDMPPAIAEVAQNAGELWGRRPTRCDSKVLINLVEGDGYVDRCHHNILWDDSTETNETAVGLDWQRYYTPTIPFSELMEGDGVRGVVTRAAEYFRKLGEEGP